MNEDEDLFRQECRKCRLPEGFTDEQIASADEMHRVAAFGGAVVILFVVSLVAFAVVYAMRAFA